MNIFLKMFRDLIQVREAHFRAFRTQQRAKKKFY